MLPVRSLCRNRRAAVAGVEIVVGHHVVVQVFGEDHLGDQVVEALAHLAACHMVVDGVYHRLLGMLQVVEHHLAAVAESLGDHLGDGDVLG